jgi:hypothetical protein
MKSAKEFSDDFIWKAQLPVGASIVFRENSPKNDSDPNWIVAIGKSSDDTCSGLVADMRKVHPRIDWSNIKDRDGEWRVIKATKMA